ncbi:MAG: hypothetical protein QNJ78_03895, partial [Gammaproteobacteria bacterium]|nr:hypothetical protein [Gammaproteobacteria bacterium]
IRQENKRNPLCPSTNLWRMYMDESVIILFDFIKHDMVTVSSYGQYILSITLFGITAGFGLTAYCVARCTAQTKWEQRFVVTANILLILALTCVAYYTFSAIDYSNNTKEMRETALKEHLLNRRIITVKDIFPDPSNHTPQVPKRMEKIPLFFAIGILILKTVIEIFWIRKRQQTRRI